MEQGHEAVPYVVRHGRRAGRRERRRDGDVGLLDGVGRVETDVRANAIMVPRLYRRSGAVMLRG
jgi:hypothetical protein